MCVFCIYTIALREYIFLQKSPVNKRQHANCIAADSHQMHGTHLYIHIYSNFMIRNNPERTNAYKKAYKHALKTMDAEDAKAMGRAASKKALDALSN